MIGLLRDLIENGAIMFAGFFFIGKLLKDPLTYHSTTREKVRAGFLTGGLGVLLMFFSIQVTPTVIMDLRHIPIIVVAYYAGFIPAIISSIIIGFARLLFGINDGSIIVVTQTILIGVVAGWVSKNYRKGSLATITFVNVLSLFIMSFVLNLLIPDKALYRNVVLFFWCIAIPSGIVTAIFFRDIDQSKRLLKSYQSQAKTDFLTGLDNVRQFDNHFNQFIKQSKDKKSEFALLLIDIDHFKKVNDTYGHDAGDSVLRQISIIIKQTTRSNDFVARNGGEEFSVLLPGSSIGEALDIAERIRSAVENYSFILPDQNEIQVTISIGVSSYPKTTQTAEDTFKQADDALYMAKTNGRNQVTAFSV